jgi:sn-glycerol 3-phosphate transport system permease protein
MMRLTRAGMYGVLVLGVAAIGLPMYWMLLAAFKTNREIFSMPPTWLPLAPTLENFPTAWNQAPFGRFYVNSLMYAFAGGGAKLLQALFTAYAFAYLKAPRKDLLFLLLLIALMIPEEFTVLPNFPHAGKSRLGQHVSGLARARVRLGVRGVLAAPALSESAT